MTTRRVFLKTFTALTGGLVVAPKLLKGAAPDSTDFAPEPLKSSDEEGTIEDVYTDRMKEGDVVTMNGMDIHAEIYKAMDTICRERAGFV